MKGKLGLILHLAALVVAAFCAYLVFSAGKAKTDKGKVILDVEPDQLTRLAFDTGKKQVVAVAREGGGFTMTVTEQIHKPVVVPKKEKGEKDKTPAAPKGTAKVAARMITETTVNTYRASQEFEKTLARLLPLRAERDLGKVGDKKLSQFGMVEAGRTMIVEAQKQKVTYLIGSQTYGGATTYVQQQPEGPVYLISSTLIRSLDVRSTRYLERRSSSSRSARRRETSGCRPTARTPPPTCSPTGSTGPSAWAPPNTWTRTRSPRPSRSSSCCISAGARSSTSCRWPRRKPKPASATSSPAAGSPAVG
jgi:hypothetical protein